MYPPPSPNLQAWPYLTFTFLFIFIINCFGYQSLDLPEAFISNCISASRPPSWAVCSHGRNNLQSIPCGAGLISTCEGKLKVRFKHHGSFESRLCASSRFEILTNISYSGSKPRLLLLVFISTLWPRCHMNSSIPRCLNNQITDTRQDNSG